MEKNYHTNVNAENTSQHTLFHWISPECKVLDVGCSVGDTGAALNHSKHCEVWGIEYDPYRADQAKKTHAYREVFQFDLDTLTENGVPGLNEQFDFILLGDVLEHLKDPAKALSILKRCLRPGGTLLLSLPNLAHCSIKCGLLLNEFKYMPFGLLDESHLHFFTWQSIADFCTAAGLKIGETKRTYLGLDGFGSPTDYRNLPPKVLRYVFQDPHSFVCQYLMKLQVVNQPASELASYNRKQLNCRFDDFPEDVRRYVAVIQQKVNALIARDPGSGKERQDIKNDDRPSAASSSGKNGTGNAACAGESQILPDSENGIPEVSIIVPVYKQEKYIKECLDSVLAQTLKNIEIICVDDCSPDSSPAILDEYRKREPRIKVIRLPENHGAFYVRRTGMLASHGKYMMFLDGDDLYEPNACERAVALIEDARTDMVVFSTSILSGDTIRREPNFLTPKFERLENCSLLDACYVKRLFTHTLWNKIYKGETVRQAAGMMTEERVPGLEDYVQFFMIASLMKSAAASPGDQLVRYRMGIGDTTNLYHTMLTMKTRPFAEQWLEKIRSTREEDRHALEAMMAIVRDDIVSNMLKVPNLDSAMLLKVGENCGAEILVRFIAATGLLNVSLSHRYNLCGHLVAMIQQRDKVIAELRSAR